MRVTISDESINSFGFWLLSSGCVLKRFKKNPVLMLQHETYDLPIGKLSDVKIEGEKITAEIEFDENDEKALKVKKKYESGFMSGFSVGFRPLVWSEDSKYHKKNQALATVVEWELVEVSAVSIPSNANAVKLYNDSYESVTLSYFDKNKNVNQKSDKMKEIALLIGLSADATDVEIAAKVKSIMDDNAAKDNQIQGLAADLDEIKLAHNAERMKSLDVLLNDPKKNLNADSKTNIKKLALVDFDLAEQTAKSLPNVVALRNVPGGDNNNQDKSDPLKELSFKELHKKHSGYLAKLKIEDFETYSLKYETEYGVKPKS